MARRVYLHIGLPKTGTTFLQTTMWHNRRLLRAQGFLYPGRRRLQHYNAFQQVRRRPPEEPFGAGGPWDDLVGELAGWSDVGLVSHEFFSMCTKRQAARVVADLGPAEVHVVMTVRSYVRQFPAVWQESVKMHDQRGFDQFMQELSTEDQHGAWGWSSQSIPKVLERWSSVVPPERITVVTVPPPGAPRDLLWQRWCQAVAIDPAGFAHDAHSPNESLGAPQAELLRRVKPHLSGALLEGPEKHRWVRRYLGHEVLVPQSGNRFLPRPDQVEELTRHSAEAAGIVRDGGYPVVGDLDDLLDPGPAPTGPHPDDVTDAELVDVAARALEQAVRDVRDLTLERDHWRDLASRSFGRRVRRAARGLVRPSRRGSATTEDDDDS